MFQSILDAVFSEGAMSVWLPLLVSSLLTLVGGLLFKGKLDAKNKLFLAGLELATSAMAKLAASTENKVDDRIALGLKVLNDHFNNHGKTLPPVDEAKAKALFLAMHGVPSVGSK